MFSLEEDQNILIESYVDLVIKYNKLFNLTSFNERSDFYDLVLQSISFADLIDSSCKDKSSAIYDMGSGNGIPSLPLSIVLKDRSFILVERSKKRAAFLNLCILKLNLSNRLKVLNVDLSSLKNTIKYAVSSALCQLNSIEKILYQSLQENSSVFLFKGPNFQNDVDNLKFFKKENAEVFSKDFSSKKLFMLKLNK